MVDLAGIRLSSGSIHDRIEGASAAAAARDLSDVMAIIEQAGLTGDPVVVAIAMLYIAHWQVAHRDDNQFAVSQESVFYKMRAFCSDDEWREVVELATQEFRSARAVAPKAEDGG
jgi:hypothetical protein